MKNLMIVSVIGLVLMGCTGEVKSVDYYMENESERSATLEKCATTQGSHQDKNCMNAAEAKMKAKAKSFFK